jgi:phytoene synthase
VIDKTLASIFRAGSRTFYHSTLFFPPRVKNDVFSLYSFVRTADDFVDAVPQQGEAFHRFVHRYRRGLRGAATGDVVIDSFVDLVRRKQFEIEWVDAFLFSMEQDLRKSSYETLEELQLYLFGSSEAVGLMMARILDLPEESYRAARSLGKAMQYINFIRDIDEDLGLGRTYFPREDLERFGLESLDYEHVRTRERAFAAFIRDQIDRYGEWQAAAEKGFVSIPRRSLIPIKTASDMYRWTAGQIHRDPFVVYRRKVKPSIPRIVGTALLNMLGTRPGDPLAGPGAAAANRGNE